MINKKLNIKLIPVKEYEYFTLFDVCRVIFLEKSIVYEPLYKVCYTDEQFKEIGSVK